MQIDVERLFADGRATVSVVLVDGRALCFGLEDEHRDVKVAGETRVPAGTYRVGVRREGGFHNRYSSDPRTRDFHRGMLHILDVPGFDWILIHIGNTEAHTAGCLLVGVAASCPPGGNWSVPASAPAYRMLYERVIGAAEAGELTIRFIDRDR